MPSTLIEGQVGPQVASDGASITIRQDKSGAMVNQQAHGRYFETTYRKAMFNGGVIGQTTSSGLATTYTGLCLSNPIGSNVLLAVNKVGFSFTTVFSAAASVGLMTGYSASTNVTHTTPVTPRNQYFNTVGGGVGLLDSSATLPVAPTINQVFTAATTGTAVAQTVLAPVGFVDLEASLILTPGAYAAIYTSTASASNAGNFSITWEEIPL